MQFGQFITRWSGVMLCAALIPLSAAGETNPFEALVGSWSGTGLVKMTGGARERGKCNATWELPSPSRVTVRDADGSEMALPCGGWSHFAR